jgi:hypothetical protein
MNEDQDRKSFRREKLAKGKHSKRKEFNDDYAAYKGMKREFKNKKQELEDIETLEELDEYQ